MCLVQVSRADQTVLKELADKTLRLVQCEGGGVRREEVEEGRVKAPALSDEQAVAIATLLVSLETQLGKPQDFEWGIENGETALK